MLISVVKILLVSYVLLCTFLYLVQEKLIFFPEKLPRSLRFHFKQQLEELQITAADNVFLHAVLFKSIAPKGVVFYLHGNAGSVYSWGEVAGLYTGLHYDVFMPDYRGYGKSDGRIRNEGEFYNDMQLAYDKVKSMYPEDQIIVIGYSIGTAVAAKIASENFPKLLILQAPYYSLRRLAKRLYPYVPTFIIKYKFETYKFVSACRCPIVTFYGDQDEVIPFESALQPKDLVKKTDKFVTLTEQFHNGMSSHPTYIAVIKGLLSN